MARVSYFFITFDGVEDKLHLNSKYKKLCLLFCIVFDLHYLCSGNIKTSYYEKDYRDDYCRSFDVRNVGSA